MVTPPANVFLIETPLQLLNAIEAKHYFKLVNNHLIVRLGAVSPEKLKPLILSEDWDKVYYLRFYYRNIEIKSKLLRINSTLTLPEHLQPYYHEYRKCLFKKRLNDLAISFSRVKNLFLGNYVKSLYDLGYMRHFANTLKHESLYILDDGTDVILTNQDRRNKEITKVRPKRSGSGFSRLKARLRETLIEWDDRDDKSVTFFSVYDMDVQNGDYLVKNEYRHLREFASRAVPSDEVYFLGQCLAEDGYVEERSYCEYLRRIKNYFVGEKLVYIPHPRESLAMINKVKDCLSCEIRQFNFPIEYEISAKGTIPKVLASFFCSALENCRIILGQKVSIKAFHIAPEYFLREPASASVRSIYEYFEKVANGSFEIIRL